jgi:hypothetical protein
MFKFPRRSIATGAATTVLATAGLAQTAAPPASPPAFATVTGMVIDSVHLLPLVGAEVVVDGTTAEARTDSAGNYRIDSVPAGRHQIAVYHPLLDSLQTSLATAPLDFAPGATTSVTLAIPSRPTLLAQLCPHDAVAQVLAIGQVRDVDADTPLPGAHVTAWLTRMTVGRNTNNALGLRKSVGSMATVTDASGSFHLCLPAGQQLSIAARLGGARTGNIGYASSDGVFFPVLRVASADSTLPVADTTAPPMAGRATLTGTVHNASGKPVANASVEVAGTQRIATTAKDGSYRIESLPSGTQLIVVRALGFPETVTTVDLTNKAPKSLASVLADQVATLPTVDIKARQATIAAALDRRGFTRRSQGKVGHFLTPDQIAKINARRATDLLSRIPGARLAYGPNGPRVVAAGSAPADGRACTLYMVDGRQVFSMGNSDDQILPQPYDIIAVEMYGAGESTVVGFTPAAGCLVFRVWTVAIAGG